MYAMLLLLYLESLATHENEIGIKEVLNKIQKSGCFRDTPPLIHSNEYHQKINHHRNLISLEY